MQKTGFIQFLKLYKPPEAIFVQKQHKTLGVEYSSHIARGVPFNYSSELIERNQSFKIYYFMDCVFFSDKP